MISQTLKSKVSSFEDNQKSNKSDNENKNERHTSQDQLIQITSSFDLQQYLHTKRKKNKGWKQWSNKQWKLLFQLYLKHGPQWSYMTKYFEQKDQHSLKNKFNSSLRKGVIALQAYQKSVYKKLNKGIINKSFYNILQFSYQAKVVIEQKGLKINQSSLIAKTRQNIINFLQNVDTYQNERFESLLANIKTLNKYLRSYDISKRKSLKGWKISQNNLKSYNQNDQIYFGQLSTGVEQSFPTKMEIKQKYNHRQQLINQINIPQAQSFLSSLIKINDFAGHFNDIPNCPQNTFLIDFDCQGASNIMDTPLYNFF